MHVSNTFQVSHLNRCRSAGLAVLLTLITASLSGQVAASSPVSADQAASIQATPPSFASGIKKSVAYLQTDCLSNDGKVLSYRSTGFFIFKPDERLGSNRGFLYLVTNRHAVQPGIEHGTPCRVVNYSISLNLRPVSPADLPLATTAPLGRDVPWTLPDDASVDLAIVPFGLDQARVDFEAIPSTQFATEAVVKERMVGEGDPVLFTGLFVQMPGLVRLEPIVRQGFIAMIPNELIGTTLGKPGKVYLADVHVFGGNSGSPMFVNLAGIRNGSMLVGSDYRLLGVVSGYEIEDTSFNLQAATTYSGTLGANSGVATVVPAEELDRLLNSKALQAQRDGAVGNPLKK